jgi:hypothetical protein
VPLEEFDEPARFKYAKAAGSIYYTAVQSTLVHQEGERRAHGLDYRIQQKAADGSTDATMRRRELMEALRVSYEKRVAKAAVTIEGTVVKEETAS